ncbi:serine/threonine-protein kinase [Sphaerisporangium corydalis]|uniref:Protein kinase n=1 Tax=Sphaerisporangium corydalis TaxID=1441875 RepID=A0ABV9ENT1_9ACTN|nr:serine/threonine-protein kinase [Sphaerisporangium corydalis]
MSNPVPLRPGDPVRVGGYELTARLGEGGQGVVYLGRSPAGVTVAVKLLRSDLTQNEEALSRFVREVSTAERVATFCTAQVIETGVADHRPFIVSEYIDGPTLDAVVESEGPRRGAALHRLAIGTVTALVAIHQAGIVHRDFKPSNVLLGNDGPRVIDFGIAKALDRSSTLTSVVVGTPAYMTPEQLGGEQAGPAADMFAWAGTMIFAATGDAPFGTDSLPAVFHRIMSVEPDLSALEEPLRGIVGACLAKDPSARPAAGEVLMRLLGHGTATAPPAAIMAEGSAVAQAAPGAVPPAPERARPSAAHSTAPPPSRGPAPPAEDPTLRWRQDPARRAAPPPPPPAPYAANAQPLPQAYAGQPDPGWQRAPSQGWQGRPPWAGGDQGAGTGGTVPTLGGPGRRSRVPLVVAAVAVVALLIGGGTYVYVQSGNDGRLVAGPSGGPGTPAPGATPSGPGSTPDAGRTGTPPPEATRSIDLPGSSITIQENDLDPIKLTFYSLDYGKRVYLRGDGKNSFAPTKKYFEYTVSADGRRALGTDTVYTTDSFSTVSLVDRVTGTSTLIRMAEAPLFPTFPQWSPDGTRVLVTINEAVGDTTKGYGYAIIDVARRKGKVVHVKEKDVGRWSYFWRGDGRAVGTWALKGGTQRIRFYDLGGTVLQTLLKVGDPLTVEGDDVSPSGTHFITTCSGVHGRICVWTTEGRETARIAFPTDRLIGWYDDQHIAGWRRKGEDYEAVVVDFQGNASRVLATAKAAEYKKGYLRYTRGT